MHSCTEIDGVPSVADRGLLTDLLRGPWGSPAPCGGRLLRGARFLESEHRIAADLGHAAGLALDAGVDVELPPAPTGRRRGPGAFASAARLADRLSGPPALSRRGAAGVRMTAARAIGASRRCCPDRRHAPGARCAPRPVRWPRFLSGQAITAPGRAYSPAPARPGQQRALPEGRRCPAPSVTSSARRGGRLGAARLRPPVRRGPSAAP